jgi:hypothetical protein
MRTNPFYDAWLFLIGRTSDHENSGVGSIWVALARAPFGPFVGEGLIGRAYRKIA